MKSHHLTITTAIVVIVAAILLIAFSPGYIEYQQIRWRTKVPPERNQAGMTGMLAMTKALEEVLGTKPLTTKDFEKFSAETLRDLQKMFKYNDLAMVSRIGYLNRLLDDPSGTELKQKLFEEIAKDVTDRIEDRSTLAESMRISAYQFSLRDQAFEKVLLTKIGSLDRLGLSKELIEDIKAEPAGAAQPATQPADKSPAKDQPSTPTSKGGPR